MGKQTRQDKPEFQMLEGQMSIPALKRFSAILPAFRNTTTGETHLSCDGDGVPAPVHMIENLPRNWLKCNVDQTRCILRENVEKGYVVLGHFFNQEDASSLLPH